MGSLILSLEKILNDSLFKFSRLRRQLTRWITQIYLVFVTNVIQWTCLSNYTPMSNICWTHFPIISLKWEYNVCHWSKLLQNAIWKVWHLKPLLKLSELGGFRAHILLLETILNDSLFKFSRLRRQLTRWITQIYLVFFTNVIQWTCLSNYTPMSDICWTHFTYI